MHNLNEEFITIHIDRLKYFLKEEDVVKVVLRYLHERGIEGGLGEDGQGVYIQYYKPENHFNEFSLGLYNFIETYSE